MNVLSFCLVVCTFAYTFAQVPDIPNLSRGNLTVKIVVKYPETALEDTGFFNAPLYVYGNGLCLSWEEGTLMEHTLEDTWEVTLTYTQTPGGYGCNDSSSSELLGVNNKLEYRVVLNDTVDMLGANCGSDLPISMSAPFYEESPEIYCNPWFFNRTGSMFFNRIQGEPDLIKERVMYFYVPPSFYETNYKQYPVVFAPDLGMAITDFIFGNPNRMEMFGQQTDDLVVNQGIVEEVILIGTADYRPDIRNPLFMSDRFDLLGPVRPDHWEMCGNGTFFNGCDGCFNITEIDNIWEVYYWMTFGGCGVFQPIGGHADTFLDFLLNEVLDYTREFAGDRALVDQEHLGLMGCSLGGLFSCYGAWTRPDVFGHAGCQSSSFYYPQNETGDPQFDFENVYINQHRENRSFQNIFMDISVPGDVSGPPQYRMAEAALNLSNSMAELPVFEWNKNLWLDGYMGMAHGNYECMSRAWVFLAEFYRPIGGPRNPLNEPPAEAFFDAPFRTELPLDMNLGQDMKDMYSDIDIQEVIALLKESLY